MPAQTHCAGKNRRQKTLPRCLFAGECGTVSVVFPFGGHPWGQHRMDGDRWRRARAQRRRLYSFFSIPQRSGFAREIKCIASLFYLRNILRQLNPKYRLILTELV